MDWPEVHANGRHDMLDTEELVTVQWGPGGNNKAPAMNLGFFMPGFRFPGISQTGLVSHPKPGKSYGPVRPLLKQKPTH